MTLEVFRNMCLDLKYIPDDEQEILDGQTLLNKYFAAECLAKAMKALKIADEIIMKQSDAILESTKELTLCLKQSRSKNVLNLTEVSNESFDQSVIDIKPISESVDTTETDCNENVSQISSEKIDSPQPVESYAMVAQAMNSTEIDAKIGNEDSDSGSDAEFHLVKKRRRRTPRKSKPVIGQNPAIRLGTCVRAKFCEIFVSRLGSNVSNHAVKEFVRSMLGEEVDVERLETKYKTYSSFKLRCSFHVRNKILDPKNWEAGVLIRPFYT